MSEDTAVLLLRLAGPMQSWGTESRFTKRGTNLEPSKSGIVGMLAAAQGRRRTDPVEDLVQLRLGVRADQPGTVMSDFQTAIRSELKPNGEWEHKARPLSHRLYLCDAIFLGVVEGPRPLIEQLDAALRAPAYPLSLGRRSCPPAGQLDLGVHPGTVEQHLREHPWLASEHHQKAQRGRDVRLAIVRDALPEDEAPTRSREHDVPISFDPQHRRFGWRTVVREFVDVPGRPTTPRPPDDYDYLEEALCS